MNDDDKVPLFSKIKHLLIGDARSVSDPSIFHKLSLIAFFAWVGLGADGLSWAGAALGQRLVAERETKLYICFRLARVLEAIRVEQSELYSTFLEHRM